MFKKDLDLKVGIEREECCLKHATDLCYIYTLYTHQMYSFTPLILGIVKEVQRLYNFILIILHS